MSELIKYSAACTAIAEAKATDEVRDIRDKAEAMRAYAHQAKNRQMEIDAAEIRIRAERRLGELIKAQKESVGLSEGGRPSAKTPANREGVSRPTLEQAGIDYKLSSHAQKVAAIPEDEFEGIVDDWRGTLQEANERVTTNILRAADKAHVSNNSGENEWYTPSEFIESARSVMGDIDIDPASCAAANETVQAKTFYTKENDGLGRQWSGRIWMNPPYSQPLISNFIDKLVASPIDAACVLVNNGTETRWGQTLLEAASAVCFPAKRIRFIDKHGNPSGAPLQGQMICYIGNEPDKFIAEFSKHGACLK